MKKFAHAAAARLSAFAVLLFGLASPLSAQSSDPYLNYLDHVSVDFAHYTAVQSNIALYYHDFYGNLQPPSDGNSGQFYLFSPKDLHFLSYDSSGFKRQFGAVGAETAWDPDAIIFAPSNLSLSTGSEVSYTPRQTSYAPPTNGSDPLYFQPAMITGSRSALYAYDLLRNVREGFFIPSLVTLSTDPATSPYTPGNALLATGAYTSLLTTNGGIYALDSTGNNGQVTPFITTLGSGSNPSALNVGPDGRLYVLDSGNNRIQKFDLTTGAYLGGFSFPAGITVSPTSLAISTEGRIYVGDGVGGGFVFSLDGTLLTTFHPPASDPGWVDGGLLDSGGGVGSFLNYDGQGNVFVYVEGQGVFMYRDPFYNELDHVNLNVLGEVTSGAGNSIVNSLSFEDDRGVLGDRQICRLTIVDPMQVRTGNIYTGAGSTGIIEGGTIVTDGNVTKINKGTLVLNNINTYAGQTIVTAGTLIVNGSIAGEAVVREGAFLGGSGVIGGLATIESGATLSPGTSLTPGTLPDSGNAFPAGGNLGTLTFANGLALNDGAILAFELGATSDLIVVSGGTLSGPSSGKITVNLTDSGGFTAGTYTLIDATGATLTSIGATSLDLGTTIAGYDFTFTQNGDLFQLIATASAVPEPAATAATAAFVALAGALLRRPRQNRPAHLGQCPEN
ncbi:MAG: hypothetical protein H7Y06_02035 [Opitutaceae bacterium]|nr:hypothetical protein [Opitutaceae bacterium]